MPRFECMLEPHDGFQKRPEAPACGAERPPAAAGFVSSVRRQTVLFFHNTIL
jgi:hypothetical protein